MAPRSRKVIDAGLGSPVALPAKTDLWRVIGGDVEVFLETLTLRRLLVIVPDGGYVFGVPGDCGGELTVTAGRGTKLMPLGMSDVENPAGCLGDPANLAVSAEHWLNGISRHFEILPRAPDTATVLSAGQTVSVSAAEFLTAKNALCWLNLPVGQSLSYWGSERRLSGAAHLPLVPGLPVELDGSGTIDGLNTAQVAAMGQICLRLRAFNSVLPDLFSCLSQYHDTATLARLAEAGSEAESHHHIAVNRLAKVAASQTMMPGAQGAIGAIITRVAESIGVEVEPDKLRGAPDTFADLPGVLRKAGLRSRQIILRDNWWRGDLGSLIAMRAGSGELVGLVRRRGHYMICDPRAGGDVKLTAKLAEQLSGPAFSITPLLASDVKDLKSLAGFIILRLKGDAMLTVFAGASIALLGVITPLATGIIIDRIIPGNARNLIVEIGVALILIAILTAFFNVARNIAQARIETQTATDLQLSVMNRILSLKPVFFRDSSAGDLSHRMDGLDSVRAAVVNFVLQATLTVAFFVFYGVLLFSFDAWLALSAVAMVFVVSALTLLVRLLQARFIPSILLYNGKLRSLVFEILDGVAKLRIAAAEERMIGRWAEGYFNEQSARLRFERISDRFSSFLGAYQTLSLLLLFGVAIYLSQRELSAGSFIAFLFAFGAFQGVVLGFCQAVVALMAAMPRLDRARPFLEAELETQEASVDPGPLSGRIEMSGIRFAYDEKAPAILDKLNFSLKAGEHVAIVGASGSGKSSILRLLLGFEKPFAGVITYDGKELSHLDVKRVRQQIGVVMQSSSLFAGSIYENIQGAGNASLEDCERAADQAGLSDDLELFPMGMHTPLTEGAGTISGGQKQRILIARALAASPGILFMDEATSALDNATQARVTDALDGLKVTRLTIAHRLSTVRLADRICVLRDGCFAEQGSYDELMALDGLFADLARRQLT